MDRYFSMENLFKCMKFLSRFLSYIIKTNILQFTNFTLSYNEITKLYL